VKPGRAAGLAILASMMTSTCALAQSGAPPSASPANPAAAPCAIRMFEETAFTVCQYRRGADALRLALNGPDGPLGDFQSLARLLGPEVARVRFAMNAGMYEPDQSPVGLYVADGVTRHPAQTRAGHGNFYLRPNGVFWLGADGTAHVQDTESFLAEAHRARWATQSGPMLVLHGQLHPKIVANGASLSVRDGVGVVGPEAAIFVISDRPVSFGRFARFFRDALNCPDALYFDGGVASLWVPSLGRRDATRGLGPLVVVTSPEDGQTSPAREP